MSSGTQPKLIASTDDARSRRNIRQETREWSSSIWPRKHIEAGHRKSAYGEEQRRQLRLLCHRSVLQLFRRSAVVDK